MSSPSDTESSIYIARVMNTPLAFQYGPPTSSPCKPDSPLSEPALAAPSAPDDNHGAAKSHERFAPLIREQLDAGPYCQAPEERIECLRQLAGAAHAKQLGPHMSLEPGNARTVLQEILRQQRLSFWSRVAQNAKRYQWGRWTIQRDMTNRYRQARRCVSKHARERKPSTAQRRKMIERRVLPQSFRIEHCQSEYARYPAFAADIATHADQLKFIRGIECLAGVLPTYFGIGISCSLRPWFGFECVGPLV
jgi:hypothetical protein